MPIDSNKLLFPFLSSIVHWIEISKVRNRERLPCQILIFRALKIYGILPVCHLGFVARKLLLLLLLANLLANSGVIRKAGEYIDDEM